MDEMVLEVLEKVPCDSQDAFNELLSIVNEKAKQLNLTLVEKERLNYELSLIKKWGIAKVFLFGQACCLNKDLECVTLGVENYSYINYLLNISKVNPVLYNLPFERYFNEYRKFLPEYMFYVKAGKKGELLKSIYQKFGKSVVMRAKDSEENYFVSNRPIKREHIEKTALSTKLNEEMYEENISFFTGAELRKLGYYAFSIIEVKEIKNSLTHKFSEKEIYKKERELFQDFRPKTPNFKQLELLKDTRYKLVYQEQVLEILNKLCGFDMQKADHLRRQFARAKKDNLEEVKKILLEKHGEKGQELFDYLCKIGRYTISKAYVLANLHNLIEY